MMIDVSKLKFDENGLIPAIITDAETGEVLTLAYMNEESLSVSINEKKTCFWSRSRGKLWRKGESSGNFQHIISIKTDCDNDALLISVGKDGPACHTGSDSCFISDLYINGTAAVSAERAFKLKTLYNIILERKENPKPGSYTNYLFDKGIDKILKKFGEEATEVVIAGKGGVRSEVVYELADLVYHAYVLMAELGIEPGEIVAELASRHTPKDN